MARLFNTSNPNEFFFRTSLAEWHQTTTKTLPIKSLEGQRVKSLGQQKVCPTINFMVLRSIEGARNLV